MNLLITDFCTFQANVILIKIISGLATTYTNNQNIFQNNKKWTYHLPFEMKSNLSIPNRNELWMALTMSTLLIITPKIQKLLHINNEELLEIVTF